MLPAGRIRRSLGRRLRLPLDFGNFPMNRGNFSNLFVVLGWMLLGQMQAQDTAPRGKLLQMPAAPQRQQVAQRSSASDAARYLAGMPVSAGSPLVRLTGDSVWIAHSNAMNAGFAKLDQSRLSNMRTWRVEFLASATGFSRTCLYFFSGPDFLYADTLYPDCTTYVLVSLEPVEVLPELQTLPLVSLQNTLQAIEAALNTFLSFGYFETQDLREYTRRSLLKGVVPILFVFLARSGKEILNVEYLSQNKGNARGVRITFFDPDTNSQKVLYYFCADLSDGGLKANQSILRFCRSLGLANSFLKAPSYLLHQDGFTIARDYLLRASASILQDDSGIPIRYFTPERWTLRLFGTYTGPIELFKNFYQPDLRRYYETSYPKPLTFPFGYQWNPHDATLILAIRK